MVFLSVFLGSCTGFRNSVYLSLIDNKTGQELIKEEPKIRPFLTDILDSYDEYTIKVYTRTPIKSQSKRTKLMTHCYYVIIYNEEEYYTLSFYGSDMTFTSRGVWVLNSDSDFASYIMFINGKNIWDTAEVFQGRVIDVKGTALNILKKLDLQMIYYYRDHMKDKPNRDNCNTALYETIVFSR
jgi:hypothetical protein